MLKAAAYLCPVTNNPICERVTACALSCALVSLISVLLPWPGLGTGLPH